MEFWDMANQIFFSAKRSATILAFYFGGLSMNFTIVSTTGSDCSKYFSAVCTFDSPTDASAIYCQVQVQTSRDSKKVDHVCKTIRKIVCLFFVWSGVWAEQVGRATSMRDQWWKRVMCSLKLRWRVKTIPHNWQSKDRFSPPCISRTCRRAFCMLENCLPHRTHLPSFGSGNSICLRFCPSSPNIWM